MGNQFGVTWKKFGERFDKDCVPLWRFEGRAILNTRIENESMWQAQNSSMAFFQIGSVTHGLKNWDPVGSDDYGYAKIMNQGTIKRLWYRIEQNSIPHNLKLSLYRDEKHRHDLATIPANSFVLSKEEEFFEPLQFGHLYSYALETEDGTIPNFEDPTQTMRGWFTTEIYFGAGDP